MSIVVDMAEAKAHLTKLVEQACQGEDVVITRDGSPAVRLNPIESTALSRRVRSRGSLAGQIWMSDDFNDPLPDDYSGIPD